MLGWVAIALILVGSVLGLFVLPPDALQGEVQRLLYVHVPIAWAMMLAFFVVFLMSILYLVQRKRKWDLLAVSAAELGVLGAVPRSSSAPSGPTPVGRLVGLGSANHHDGAPRTHLRRLPGRAFDDGGPGSARALVRRDRLIAFVQVPVVYMSVFWWRSLHQPPSSPRPWRAPSARDAAGVRGLHPRVHVSLAAPLQAAATELELELSGPEDGEINGA